MLTIPRRSGGMTCEGCGSDSDIEATDQQGCPIKLCLGSVSRLLLG